ncbi:MAG: hypothetical protein IJW29_06270 [Clostridia bacterium]|nr:hypothetical protein [Clostridia bacterium]
MKKTVRTVDYLCMFFLMCAWAFRCEGFWYLAFAAILAAILCFGIGLGSFAYDAFHWVKNRMMGGE